MCKENYPQILPFITELTLIPELEALTPCPTTLSNSNVGHKIDFPVRSLTLAFGLRGQKSVSSFFLLSLGQYTCWSTETAAFFDSEPDGNQLTSANS